MNFRRSDTVWPRQSSPFVAGVAVLEYRRAGSTPPRYSRSLFRHGRGCGVGLGLGIGIPLGVGVGRGVGVGVAVAEGVAVGVGVTEGVGVTVGVGVGIGPEGVILNGPLVEELF